MHSRILVPLIALAVAAQTCCCCTVLGGPQPPYAIIPSDQAITRFQERLNAVEPSADGSVSVTITEEEMTSLVARSLATQEESSPIGETQVHFRNGRVEVYTTVYVADSLALPGLVAFSITATGGEIAVTVEDAAFGPLPVPEPILQSVTAVLNSSLTQSIQVDGVEVLITDVQIGEGQMTIFGQAPSASSSGRTGGHSSNTMGPLGSSGKSDAGGISLGGAGAFGGLVGILGKGAARRLTLGDRAIFSPSPSSTTRCAVSTIWSALSGTSSPAVVCTFNSTTTPRRLADTFVLTRRTSASALTS